jgi:hypothetical protein
VGSIDRPRTTTWLSARRGNTPPILPEAAA